MLSTCALPRISGVQQVVLRDRKIPGHGTECTKHKRYIYRRCLVQFSDFISRLDDEYDAHITATLQRLPPAYFQGFQVYSKSSGEAETFLETSRIPQP